MPSEVGFSRGDVGFKPDLAQRPSGLRTAGEFSRLADGGDEFLFEPGPPRDFHQPAQAFAGHQHEVVAWLGDKAADPGLDRRGVRGVMDGEHRALQYIGALFGQQPRKLGFLARFQDQDAVAAQSVSHGFDPVRIACCWVILNWAPGLAQGP